MWISIVEHDTTELFTLFSLKSKTFYNDFNISYNEEMPRIVENSLIMWTYRFVEILPLSFCNVLKMLNRKQYTQFCRSMRVCSGKHQKVDQKILHKSRPH